MRPSALAILTGAAGVALLLAPAPARAQSFDPTAEEPVTVDDLQQATEPYGEWIDTPDYGRVWRPDQEVVGDEFEPYVTNGRWVSTDQGWSFESAWAWGWAPFHYGRWVYDRHARWLWSPDVVWSPAWVEWRTSADYVAWLPLAPRSLAVDPRVTVGLWMAVEMRSFLRPDLQRYRVAPSQRLLAGRPSAPTLPRGAPPPTIWRGAPPHRPAVAAARLAPAAPAHGKAGAGH
jgi:hypothetical protein